jgi:hypothetical protein
MPTAVQNQTPASAARHSETATITLVRQTNNEIVYQHQARKCEYVQEQIQLGQLGIFLAGLRNPIRCYFLKRHYIE